MTRPLQHGPDGAVRSSTSPSISAGSTAIADMTFEVSEGEVCRSDRSERRRQDDGLQRDHRLPAPPAARSSTAARAQRPRAARDRRRSALVRTFQKTSVFGGHSVLDNILIGLHLRAASARSGDPRSACRAVAREERRSRPRRARSALRRARMRARASAADALPYGEQRLLEVAVALAAQPTLLLLDEPVSGMNAVGDGELHAAARQDPRARHHGAARRARHEHGDGRLRSRRRASTRAASSPAAARPRSSGTPK